MAKIDVINQAGQVVDSVELNDAVFGVEPHQQALYEVLVMAAAGRRQGTSATKGRSDVSGGGRKPYRQKGTGNARQGSIRAPHYRGGGTVFGAVQRDYSYRVNKKVRRLALVSALSEKVQENQLGVVDQLVFEQPKTKSFLAFLKAIVAPKKVLVVCENDADNQNLYLSARNVPGVKVVTSRGVNVTDLVHADEVVLTLAAVKEVEEALA